MSWIEEEEAEWWIDYSPPVGPLVTPSPDWGRFVEELKKEYTSAFMASFAPIASAFKQLTAAGIIVETQTKPTLEALSKPNTRKTYGPQHRSTFSRNGKKNY